MGAFTVNCNETCVRLYIKVIIKSACQPRALRVLLLLSKKSVMVFLRIHNPTTRFILLDINVYLDKLLNEIRLEILLY